MQLRRMIETPTVVKNRLKAWAFNVKIGKKARMKGRVRFSRFGNISIGDNCVINGLDKYNPIGCGNGSNIIAEKTGHIIIGDSFAMSNSTIYSRCSITIGNHVLIGGGVKIYDTDFHSLDPLLRGTANDKNNTKNAPIIIEDEVFIGAGSFILKGVHIGRGAVIGAGSVVTKSIPKNEIWAGNPAKSIN